MTNTKDRFLLLKYHCNKISLLGEYPTQKEAYDNMVIDFKNECDLDDDDIAELKADYEENKDEEDYDYERDTILGDTYALSDCCGIENDFGRWEIIAK